MTLFPIDYLIIALYLLGVVGVGLYLARGVETSADYFLAGRRLPFWMIGLSIVATDIGATSLIGLGGEAYRYGLVVANWDWIGSFMAMILAAFIFIPYYWRTKVYTIPEFLGRRYNQAVRTLYSVIWIVILVFDVGITLYAAGLLMETALGWNYWATVGVITVVVAVYMTGAGISAAIAADLMHSSVMFIGGFALLGAGLWKVGGLGELVSQVRALGPDYALHFSLYRPPDGSSPYPWTGVLFGLGFVMSTSYFAGNQTLVQNCLSAKSEWDAKATMIFGALLKALVPVMMVVPGIIALVVLGKNVPPGQEDRVLPLLIKTLLPPGLVGLMFAAFLAAMMTAIDSALNALATIWTKDIYQLYLRKDATEKELLWMGRATILTVLVSSALTSQMSRQFEGLYQFTQTLLSLIAGPGLAILVLGMFWKKTTPWGGFWGLLLGSASAFLMGLDSVAERLFSIKDPFLYVSFWSFWASVAAACAVSLFTEPKPEEEIAPLLWRRK